MHLWLTCVTRMVRGTEPCKCMSTAREREITSGRLAPHADVRGGVQVMSRVSFGMQSISIYSSSPQLLQLYIARDGAVAVM